MRWSVVELVEVEQVLELLLKLQRPLVADVGVQVQFLELSEHDQELVDLEVESVVANLVQDGQHLHLDRPHRILHLAVVQGPDYDVFAEPHEDVDPGRLHDRRELHLCLRVHALGSEHRTLADEADVLDEEGIDAVLSDEGVEDVEIDFQRLDFDLQIRLQELPLA